MPRRVIVGLISDTHGLLRPEAVEQMRGSDCIVHAGDIGDPRIVAELGRLAPVTAVRGNVDTGDWAQAFPASAVLEAGGVSIYVVHRIEDLEIDPAAAGVRAVVYGHSHRPELRWRDGVLYANPGSAGRRRFSLPVSVGRLVVAGGAVTGELLEIG